MSSTTVRVAIVGLVQGLEDVYTVLHHPRYTLVAVCDTNPRPWHWLTGEENIDEVDASAAVFQHHKDWVKASRNAPGFGDVEYLSDFDAVLARDDIDAVVLVLPDVLHAPFAIKALEARKYVLSTKPMARTMDEAFAISEAARQNPNHYMLGFQLSYSGFATAIREIIASGEIGTPRQIRFDYHRGPWRPVHRKKYAEVDGSMIKEGVHWLDMIYRLSGELPWQAIAGFGGRETFPDDFEFEDNGVLIIDFPGFRAAHTFTYFRRSLTHSDDFLLVGDRGTIRGTFEKFDVETDDGTRTVIPTTSPLADQHHYGYYEMHDAFSAMVLDGVEPYTNWRTGLENMLTCYASQIAVAENRMVTRAEFADVDWRETLVEEKAAAGA
ncbi:Gfo/Idh/MocA family protein [Microbacterium sp. EST19A]|uniref:Gfo/Idh/MocA family protein n=1 Tax=Microbacterium sp. EST19A TaxID=2862681 RepID=UPI001CBD4EDD|nr:Gfo/Idh/MocA family oxidoreductase [Microbacterium sp. EST19A]